MGAHAAGAGRKDARPGAGDARRPGDGPRLGRRTQHYRRGQARRAGDRRGVQPRHGGLGDAARPGSRRGRPRHLRRGRHVHGRHLEGHGDGSLPAAGQPRTAPPHVSRARAGHPAGHEHVRDSRMGARREGRPGRGLWELVYRAALLRAGANRRPVDHDARRAHAAARVSGRGRHAHDGGPGDSGERTPAWPRPHAHDRRLDPGRQGRRRPHRWVADGDPPGAGARRSLAR